MKRFSRYFAIAAGALSVGLSLYFWRERTELGLISALPLAWGILGSIGAVLASPISNSIVHARWILMACCGGLVALGFVGIMSMGPFVFGVLFLLALATALNRIETRRSLLGGALVFLGCALLCFAVLLRASTHTGVKMVELPSDSPIETFLPRPDYADAFRIEIPSGFDGDMESVARSFMQSMRPSWLSTLTTAEIELHRFEPGSSDGGWPVHYLDDDEIIFGLDRSHIDLRLSLKIEDSPQGKFVTATTITRFNNWKGSLYFIPVRYGHQIVLADTMRKLKARLVHGDVYDKG